MQRFYVGMASFTLMVLGFTVSIEGYRFPELALNYYQATGSTIFWAGVLLLALTLAPAALKQAVAFARTARGAVVGAAYLAFHLVFYGFVLEAILVQIYGSPTIVSSPFAFVSSSLLYPASPVNALAGMAFNPTLTILAPPVFDTSLSLFSIVTAVVVDVLIVANVGAVGRIGSVSAQAVKARAYVAMPMAGIFLGASCCMSLPVLLSIADPAFTSFASLLWVFYLTYFALPVLAAVVLKLNLDLANRTATAALRLAATAAG